MIPDLELGMRSPVYLAQSVAHRRSNIFVEHMRTVHRDLVGGLDSAAFQASSTGEIPVEVMVEGLPLDPGIAKPLLDASFDILLRL